MNNEQLMLTGLLAGMLLGLIFFLGLWVTVRRLPASDNPRKLLTGSFIFRLLLILTGFWYILANGPPAFFSALAGFMLIRHLLVKIIGNNPSLRRSNAAQP